MSVNPSEKILFDIVQSQNVIIDELKSKQVSQKDIKTNSEDLKCKVLQMIDELEKQNIELNKVIESQKDTILEQQKVIDNNKDKIIKFQQTLSSSKSSIDAKDGFNQSMSTLHKIAKAKYQEELLMKDAEIKSLKDELNKFKTSKSIVAKPVKKQKEVKNISEQDEEKMVEDYHTKMTRMEKYFRRIAEEKAKKFKNF